MFTIVALSIEMARAVRNHGFHVAKRIHSNLYVEERDVTASTDVFYIVGDITTIKTFDGIKIGLPGYEVQILAPEFETKATLYGRLEIGTAMKRTTLHLYGEGMNDEMKKLITALEKFDKDFRHQISAEKRETVTYYPAE